MNIYNIYSSSSNYGKRLIAKKKYNSELSRDQLFKLKERESKKYGAQVIIIKQ